MIIFQYRFLVKEIIQIMSESNNVWGTFKYTWIYYLPQYIVVSLIPDRDCHSWSPHLHQPHQGQSLISPFCLDVQSFIKTQKKILEKIKKMSTHSPADQWRVDPCWASALVAENIYFSWKCRDFNWSMQIVNTDGPFNDWLIQQFTEWRHQFISVSICQSQRIRFREHQKISFRFLIMENRIASNDQIVT